MTDAIHLTTDNYFLNRQASRIDGFCVGPRFVGNEPQGLDGKRRGCPIPLVRRWRSSPLLGECFRLVVGRAVHDALCVVTPTAGTIHRPTSYASLGHST